MLFKSLFDPVRRDPGCRIFYRIREHFLFIYSNGVTRVTACLISCPPKISNHVFQTRLAHCHYSIRQTIALVETHLVFVFSNNFIIPCNMRSSDVFQQIQQFSQCFYSPATILETVNVDFSNVLNNITGMVLFALNSSM